MIISASRRTDIPAYFSEWFMNRMREGYALVKNPMNPHSISRVSLARADIDGIVFWTKNPLPMLDRLHELSGLPYYFQFTLNSYSSDIEPGLPSKNDVLIPAFTALSDIVGPDRIVWRYDPILLSEKYTVEYHIRYFEAMARRLSGYTKACTISFLDMYRNTEKNLQKIGLKSMCGGDIEAICSSFSKITSAYVMRLSACAEEADLTKYGIKPGRCIDPEIFENITGKRYKRAKDPNQRAACGCLPSIDIGAYNSCMNGCLYCYANYNPAVIKANTAAHDPDSPLLIGMPGIDDMIKERRIASSIDTRPAQCSIFDETAPDQ